MDVIPYRFLTRGGTAANLSAVNEIPLRRELVAELDTGKTKLGDGVTHYNDLPYMGGGGSGIGVIGFNVGNGLNVVTTGKKGRIYLPFDGTIESATIVCDQAGDLVVDIWKESLASYPPVSGDSICAGAKPTIVINDSYSDSALAGWTVSFVEGDVMLLNVDACSGIRYFCLSLKVAKT